MNIDPTKLKQFLTKKQFGGSTPFYQNPFEYKSPFPANQPQPNQGSAINPLIPSLPNWDSIVQGATSSQQSTRANTPRAYNPATGQIEYNYYNNPTLRSERENAQNPTSQVKDVAVGNPQVQTTKTTQPTTATQPAVANDTSLSDEDYQTWKRLDEKAKAGKQTPTENLNLINPYGGVDITAGLTYGAFQAGQGNAGQASLGFGRGLFGLARTTANAYGAGKNYKRGLDAQNNDTIVNYTGLEKGGEVKVSELLTNKYTTETPNANVEVEQNEFILNSENNQVSKAVGETHEDGGIKTNLPGGSKVLSDHLTLGNKGAKEISKELNVKAKAKDTYAQVLEKYSNKIGVNKKIKEEAKLIEKTEKAMSLEDNDTKDLNAMYLEKDFKRVQEEKQVLNAEQQEAFDKLYERQEASKPLEEQSQMFQDGGEVDPEQIFQELLAQGMSEEEAIAYMEQMQTQEAPQDDITAQIQALLEQGETPDNIVQMLLEQGYSEEEAVQVVQSAMPQMQDGGKTGRGTTEAFYKRLELLSEQLGVTPPKINVNATGKAKDAEWGKMQAWLNTNAPDVVENYMKDQPLTNKGMRNLFATKKEELKAAGIDVNRKPESFTPEERRALQSKIQLDGDFLRDAFNDNLSGYRYPEIGIVGKLNTTVKTNNQITAPLPTANQLSAPQQATNPTQPQNNRTAIPMFPTVEGMPPSAMLIPRTDQVTFNRIRPTTITPEVAIASANNQSNFAVEQAYANNPNIAAFAAANLIGTTQQSANQAINQADMYNAQANDKANLYNAQVGDKEQLMNIELANNYERRLFTSLGNQESDWNRYFTQKGLQNKQNWLDVGSLQRANATSPYFQTDGTNAYLMNPANFNGEQRQNQMELDQFYKALTPQQQLALIKRNNQ